MDGSEFMYMAIYELASGWLHILNGIERSGLITGCKIDTNNFQVDRVSLDILIAF